MKVALIAFGPLTYSVSLAAALSSYCEIDLYWIKYQSEKPDTASLKLLSGKSEIYLYNDLRNRDPKNVLVYFNLFREIRDRAYDLMHVQYMGTHWMALYWRMLEGIPSVITIHDPYQHPGLSFAQRNYYNTMQKLFARKAKKVIVHGEVLKKQCIENYRLKEPDNVVVIPHGDYSIYKYWDGHVRSNAPDTNIRRVLFFGRIRLYKGLQYLIRAESLISERLRDYEIVIAGEGDMSKYIRLISDSSKFRFENKYIPDEEVYKYFNDASVVVLPYIWATQSGIIPIAYAFGKPVVATTVGALPEVVEHGKTGYLVKPRDERALADAIIRLLTDEDLLREMGHNAFRYAKENLSWNSIANKTLEVYRELV